MSFLKVFLLLFVINLKSQSEISNQKFKLEIEIQNIKNDGDMYFALYNNDENFNSPNESTELMLLAIKEKVFVNNHRMNIFLAKGNYAIKIYIDKNYNEKFDFNFFGGLHRYTLSSTTRLSQCLPFSNSWIYCKSKSD